MDVVLDDGGYDTALADAQMQEVLLENKLIGNYWATQRINIAWNEGSDRFRRNQTYITWFIRHYMKKMGLINKDQHRWLMLIIGATEAFYGVILCAAGLTAFYNTYQKWQFFRASIETGRRVAQGPPGWAMIAFALAMAGGIVGGVYAGTVLHEITSNPEVNLEASIKIDWTSPSGRAAITQAIHQELTGGMG